ncbi:Nmda1 protein [Toxoplasma gondii RUB]|uniref:Nmda1 protein n=1 Tax=Toxoplasma gondii RUB TaxID=935652 RepID=A0A086M5S9_TOXGO|nr:Nmda1 protein [Toxoplasma gondii RUB]
MSLSLPTSRHCSTSFLFAEKKGVFSRRDTADSRAPKLAVFVSVFPSLFLLFLRYRTISFLPLLPPRFSPPFPFSFPPLLSFSVCPVVLPRVLKMYASYDVEAGLPASYEMNEKVAREIRFAFVRKVYGIISFQLAVTFAVSVLFTAHHATRQWVQTNGDSLLLLGGLSGIAVLLAMTCNPGITRRYPHNYFLLFFFTLCESVCVGAVCTFYDPAVVLQALLATTVIVAGLTLFAFQTDYDFTSWLGAASFFFWGVFALGLLRVLFWRAVWFQIVACVLFAGVYGVYILIDMHLLIKRGRISFDEDDYIFAALCLYVDIVGLFLELLRLLAILGGSEGRD